MKQIESTKNFYNHEKTIFILCGAAWRYMGDYHVFERIMEAETSNIRFCQ
ncbi:hypothetical protein B4166_2679 [Caldibacillus thermoamylovorans]|uniref:Uncharacterized protein n=1 Tax=Caldibacillus thermoamylovorans TaxID=35841 RepID=A0ABD4A824_9BACI|nr:hypothetical protein B4166_2679 [Caldibacillus thermoamylovorans]KIO73143.1 hypothetical protein B4167_2395 [Caldibacillus thermoamylovorans]